MDNCYPDSVEGSAWAAAFLARCDLGPVVAADGPLMEEWLENLTAWFQQALIYGCRTGLSAARTPSAAKQVENICAVVRAATMEPLARTEPLRTTMVEPHTPKYGSRDMICGRE